MIESGCSLQCLNAWSPDGDTVWGGCGASLR